MPKYLVETVSIFRITYVIECENAEHAADTVVMNEAEEFSQNHIDENILNVREVTDEEVIQICDKENAYLLSWTDEQKLALVHKVDYSKL